MPQVEIRIGGRSFEVACQPGEESYLEAAAQLLDTEAEALSAQIGRLPESRMLLMAGLMLADRTAGLEDRLRAAERLAAELKAQVETLQGQPAAAPRTVEVPVVPRAVVETLADLAARAEALADEVEARGPGGAAAG